MHYHKVIQRGFSVGFSNVLESFKMFSIILGTFFMWFIGKSLAAVVSFVEATELPLENTGNIPDNTGNF